MATIDITYDDAVYLITGLVGTFGEAQDERWYLELLRKLEAAKNELRSNERITVDILKRFGLD